MKRLHRSYEELAKAMLKGDENGLVDQTRAMIAQVYATLAVAAAIKKEKKR